jgi:hypothetical protein
MLIRSELFSAFAHDERMAKLMGMNGEANLRIPPRPRAFNGGRGY